MRRRILFPSVMIGIGAASGTGSSIARAESQNFHLVDHSLEVDRTHIHDLSHEALHAYAASDARLARELTERRWGTAARFVDRLPRARAVA